MKSKIMLLSVLAATGGMILNGCGSGSSSSSDAAVLSGTFVDSEVEGLDYSAEPSRLRGQTDADGKYDFKEGDTVTFSLGCIPLGSALGSTGAVTPVDLFDGANTSDQRVVNIARTLQSLDEDGQSGNGIRIPAASVDALVAEVGCDADLAAMGEEDLTTLLTSVVEATATDDRVISEETAVNHLDIAVSGDANGTMFRKNISKTPELASSKPKLNFMEIYVDAQKADGTPVYEDETNTTRKQVHPLVTTYTDAVEGAGLIHDGTPAHDTFAAISLDDGATWKRLNLSRTATRSSFDIKVRDAGGNVVLDENGTEVRRPYPGHSHKPVVQSYRNSILVVWDDKFCRSGNPLGLDAVDENGTIVNPSEYEGDVTYPDDMYLVNGSQGSVDYADMLVNGVYPFVEVGEVPYSCVMAARIVIDADAEDPKNVIVPYVAEQITSARRDALQIFLAKAPNGAGFGFTWQEDPEGLRPGSGKGPGTGWGGATTNHKTDIWYSYITLGLNGENFQATDPDYVPQGDQNMTSGEDENQSTRPHALNKFALPVRISDNDVCSVDENDTVKQKAKYCHIVCDRYGWVTQAMIDAEADQADPEYVATDLGKCFGPGIDPATGERSLLNGDTGASRPNIFIQPQGARGTVTIFGYEETKGLGDGQPEDSGTPNEGEDDTNWTDTGKYVIYESFKFDEPELLTPDEDLVISGGHILNEKNAEGIYENARRIRFIPQGIKGKGASGVVLAAVYKQGMEGQGRPSDIMLARFKDGYAFSNYVDTVNISSVTPTLTDEDYNTTKVLEWEWTPANLADASDTNPYDDTRAHRGIIRGDMLIVGYSYTPNWAAARQAHDKYDFYIRRSFDGGATWVPWTDTNGTSHEGPQNLSNLRNNKMTVIEPRIVGTPGSIDLDGDGQADTPMDKQNKDIFFVSYGTAENVANVIGSLDPDEVIEGGAPLDLFYARTTDRGETYELVDKNITSEDSNLTGTTVQVMDWLAHSNAEEGEVQLRMTPDGNVFYASWIQDLDMNDTETADHFKGSDIWFRKITYDANTTAAVE
ncbi:choice-of-anchor O protein [Sulfurovum mangrovi]|uniref:choice-of-anchor O protein n=1 Tax=Sulfurovum mangrovi TaxID=2893889 RepID=UPI001E35190F|nr:choice-of-anchor O protein [Sulfurovum mangrovi]UFH58647.1 choice-of-anchor O protein [Sulfurovum mangrovi]